MGISGSVTPTLALLQQRQMQIEAMVKEDRQVAAARVVRRFAVKHDWPEEDVDEVLAALGLTHRDEEKHDQARVAMDSDSDSSGGNGTGGNVPRRLQRSNRS